MTAVRTSGSSGVQRARRSLALLALLSASCAGIGTRPDDASAVEHRRAALEGASDVRERLAAAEQLKAFELEACLHVAPEIRLDCPLEYLDASVTNVEGGVLVRPRGGCSVSRLAELMRCHRAFGRARHIEHMAGCPLYLLGLEVEATGSDSIRITSSDEEVAHCVRERSHAMLERNVRPSSSPGQHGGGTAPGVPFLVGGGL